VLTVPDANGDAVVMERGETMVIDRLAFAVICELLESFTVMVAILVPVDPVGRPLITPVEELIVSPAGKPVADHVYGPVPPVAATVAV
jgi:hypothetical protein